MPLLKRVIQPLGKSVLIPLGLTAAASVVDAGKHKRILGFVHNTTFVDGNNEMKDLSKIVKCLEDSRILLRGVSETVESDVKEQRGGFLTMLMGTLAANLLSSMLTGKGIIRAGEGTIRTGYGSKRSSLKNFGSPHPLTNFEIQAYYQNEPRFNEVHSRDNLPHKIKDGTYVINLDEYSDIGTHWEAVYVNNKTVTYFDSFGIEHIYKEIRVFMKDKDIIANIYKIQSYDSIICVYYCIGFINFMLQGSSLAVFTNLFSQNNFKENDDIILNYFLIFKMVEISSAESIEPNSIDISNLNNQQFRLNKISEIENYLISENKERELMSKRLSRYIASFDYFDKSLIVLSAISGSISIASFATVIGTLIRIAKCKS